MEINSIKTLIENKLALIDICNKQDKCANTSGKIRAELHGMALLLNVMGFNLVFDINPYYYENENPSTYKISLL